MASTEICTLATTGGTSPVLLGVIGAALLILGVAAVIVSRRDRGRRGLLLGLGALAVIGAVTFLPVLTVAPAQAAASDASSKCLDEQSTLPKQQVGDPEVPPSDRPDVEKPDVEKPDVEKPDVKDPEVPPLTSVQPEAPTLAAAACGVEPAVVLPNTLGVVYSQSRAGDTVTITAVAAPEYVLAEDALTTWTLSVAAEACQCVPDELIWGEDINNKFSFNLQNGSVTNLPTGWAQSLADQGASFEMQFEETRGVGGTWKATTGALPAEVDSGRVQFVSETHSSGTSGVVSSTGDLGFDVTTSVLPTSGQTATEQMQQARADLQAQYPDLGIGFSLETYSLRWDVLLTVTMEDSCGNGVTREVSSAYGSAAS